MNKKLESFLASIPIEEISRRLELSHSIDKEYIVKLLETFSNEARVTLDLVGNRLVKNKRVLEIGAGLCLFSLFLKKEGYNIIALEPALGGFGVFEQIKNEILLWYVGLKLEVLNIPADKLNKNNHGCFDIVFSNNVIEHIPNLEESFLAMSEVLSNKGIMLHSCPNYLFPYEPHFGIPVIKPFSKLFKRVFKISSKANSDIWDSLNFIT